MASNYTNPINILDSNNATGLGTGGSLNVEGGASIKQDTFIGGNVSISGTTTSFSDNILLINKNPTQSTDTGIIFQRYTSDIQNNDNYAGIIYSEQNDAFNLGYLVSDADRNYVSIGNLVSLNTKEITTGNINFTGNLYKNGTLYNPGSQWTTTNSDISYTSGNVITSNLITTNISGSNLRLSGDLYVGGTLSTVNVTTTNVVDINISTGTITVSGLSNFANAIATNISTGTINATGLSSLQNVTATNISSSTLNNSGLLSTLNIISSNTTLGSLNATNSTITNVVATTLTSGNIYFTGNLYKNGVLFAGTSQWSNGAGTIHYTSGNVGIGRINPEYTLDVTGNARVTATSQNTATGGVTLITLERPGVSGTTYPSYVDFNVHRYSQVSSDAWTQLDLNLSNGQSVGRTNVMTLRGNGNVGIGTTAPGYKLDVVGSANFTANLLATNISGGNISAGNLNANLVNSAKMNVSHTSNNLITGGIALLTLNRPGAVNQAYDSSVDFNIHRYSNVNYAAFTQLDINLTNGLSSDRTNVMTLRGNGNVGIGTTAPAYQLHLSSDSAAKPSTNTWTISSDIRLKTNITMANLDICYDNVKNIPLKRYTWRDDIYTTDQVHDRSKLGWIAQDVETFIPKAVEQMEMHGYSDCRTLNSDQIIASLYGSVQKLIQDFENETTQHNATKQALDNLKTELQNKFPGEFN
jgi:hypothetical protein